VILRPERCAVEIVPTATKGTRPVLRVAADTDDAEFLVVLTLQQGAPPPVSWQDGETGGTFTVGGQTLGIADGKIIWKR
jgi:hypothetical protein